VATVDEPTPRQEPRYGDPPEQPNRFQPRVEAEEGDPTPGDFIIGAAIAIAVVAGLLWAFGVINF
jgi:hypothetical protein